MDENHPEPDDHRHDTFRSCLHVSKKCEFSSSSGHDDGLGIAPACNSRRYVERAVAYRGGLAGLGG